MEYSGLNKHKSRLHWLLMLMMIHILMVGQTQGDCIEEERKALLQIKASHMKSYDSNLDHFLPTWVDYGSRTSGYDGGNCCDWERVKCNTTTGHVTELSFYNLRWVIDNNMEFGNKSWPLNVSLFLHFKELTSLNLSHDFLDKETMKIGLERLSSLKKLKVLDLSGNHDIDNDIIPSLKTLTSVKILDLSDTSLNGNFPISEFVALKNLEVLDLSYCYFNGTFEIQGFETGSILTKLKILNLGNNRFDESIITSLSILSSLTNLDLSYNQMSGSFPAQACKSLSRLKRLENINLSYHNFNKSIISCLSTLPSLKILDLSYSTSLGSSFPFQEFHDLPDLEVLLLRDNGFSGTLPIEAFASFRHLEVLDLNGNNFVGSIPSAIHALSSLRALSLANNHLNGSLPDHGFSELKNLHELDLSHNRLHGTLPQCLNNLSSLKMLDISSNQLSGIFVASLIANLTSLEYIDISHNNFEGLFSFSSFSNHSKLEVILFSSDSEEFVVETEEPTDWIPMFQLQILELSNCIVNMPKGQVVPGFLLHQHKLRELHLPHNSLEGHFPSWFLKNNTNLDVLNLRNNSFGSMPLYRNANMKWLDMSGNHIIGNLSEHIPKFFPNIIHLNLSMNGLTGAIPSSISELSKLSMLDLSGNKLSGEVPKGMLTNISGLQVLKLSENNLHGQVLSGNLSWGNYLRGLYLDSNHFTGKIGTVSQGNLETLISMDISNNLFTGVIPDWITNIRGLTQLVVRNNSFKGRFPCGIAQVSVLDISQNYFSGPIPSCLLKFQISNMQHLHMGSNRFTGSVPKFFRSLTIILTLDISNNDLSGRIPKFLGKLSTLRILLLRKNKFSGSIPKQLCKLRDVSLLDLSNNHLSGSIPSCLQNITGGHDLAFIKRGRWGFGFSIESSYHYESTNFGFHPSIPTSETVETQNEVEFTTKTLFLHYKGDILDYMTGLDLSSNKLTGEIPQELGLLSQIRALNLSHNQLTGPIPVNFSNLANIESLDLSSNGLTSIIPSQLVQLTFLEVLNVSHNNLSGRLPEMKAQFGTFTKASYEGNPLLCGPPLENKCTIEPQVTDPSLKEESSEKWYDIDMVCFYGSSSATCVVFLLGFVGLLYVNPYWRRRWLDMVGECMYICYYFLYDSVRKPCMIFHN
ncbi:hypothetical protein Lser_V15G01266 [Lactuca serriola]